MTARFNRVLLYVNEKLFRHPNTLNMEILFINEDPTSLSKLATFCSISMASMMEGKNHAEPKLKEKAKKRIYNERPSNLQVNRKAA